MKIHEVDLLYQRYKMLVYLYEYSFRELNV